MMNRQFVKIPSKGLTISLHAMTIRPFYSYLRRLVRRNIYLYKSTVRVRRLLNAFRDPLSMDRIDLCVEGFPSSGNSFAHAIVHLHHAPIKTSHHTHTIANVKMARKYKVPTLILLREPAAAIASYLSRFADATALDTVIRDYIDFNAYICKIRHEIVLIHFSDLVERPALVMAYALDCVGLNIEQKTIEDHLPEIQFYVSFYAKEYGISPSMPAKERAESVRSIRDSIIQHAEYERAYSIYSELVHHLEQI